ncbi:hypothetical protein [Chryseobacterium aquaeductus]|uniref:hypothetical protein n=1 Tax=Chryseobacterium aquaeductus TaxID=2675056 RepID=UPI00138998FF|nr:hypothetical protein [Chryseobacterium aquaeductus]
MFYSAATFLLKKSLNFFVVSILFAQNTSQLQNKKVGGTSLATPLQSIDYQYNIRG